MIKKSEIKERMLNQIIFWSIVLIFFIIALTWKREKKEKPQKKGIKATKTDIQQTHEQIVKDFYCTECNSYIRNLKEKFCPYCGTELKERK